MGCSVVARAGRDTLLGVDDGRLHGINGDVLRGGDMLSGRRVSARYLLNVVDVDVVDAVVVVAHVQRQTVFVD